MKQIMRGILGLILYVTSIGYIAAQNQLLLPEDFSVYKYRLQAVNPAYADTGKFYAVSGYMQYGPPLNQVNSFYFLGGVKFGNSQNFHYSSLSLMNQKTGPFKNRPRLNLIHSYKLTLSQNYYLNAGISVGLIGYYFNSPYTISNESFTALDLNSGLRITGPWFAAGASINQIPNALVQPRLAIYQYPRFYNLDYSLEKDLSPVFKLSHFTLLKIAPENLSTIHTMADLKINNLFGAGAGFRSVSGMFFYIEIDLAGEDNLFSFNAAYNSSILSKNVLGVNLYEFTLRWKK